MITDEQLREMSDSELAGAYYRAMTDGNTEHATHYANEATRRGMIL